MASGETSSAPPSPRRDVYARLSDVRSYTGIYRKRFELDIHDVTEEIVHNLSSMTRTNLNFDVGNEKAVRGSGSPSRTASLSSLERDLDTDEFSPGRQGAASPIKLEGDPNDPHTLLRGVFHYYCRYGRKGSRGANETTMDNANFSKFCRECPKLLESSLTNVDVDLIFFKAKKKAERRINYARFLDALGMLAMQKFPDLPLEISVPKLLHSNIAGLPCVLEFINKDAVQAAWKSRRPASTSDLPSPQSTQPASPCASLQSELCTSAMPPPAPVLAPVIEPPCDPQSAVILATVDAFAMDEAEEMEDS